MDLSDLFSSSIVQADDLFIVKIALFFMFFAFIFFVLGRASLFKEQKPIHTIVSLILAVFCVYYMPEKWITDYILYYYGIFGFSLIFLFPFLIILFAVHKKNTIPFVRRFVIFVFGLFLFFIGFFGYFEFGDAIYIYLFIILFVIVFDGFVNKVIKNRKRFN